MLGIFENVLVYHYLLIGMKRFESGDQTNCKQLEFTVGKPKPKHTHTHTFSRLLCEDAATDSLTQCRSPEAARPEHTMQLSQKEQRRPLGFSVHPFRDQVEGTRVELPPRDFTFSHCSEIPFRQLSQIICHQEEEKWNCLTRVVD